ncbi:unnamed protein product, partial [Ectocarpus sp. 6 AP-2014]
CEDVVLTPPGPEDLLATYVLARGSQTILETLKQLSDKLGLPPGSEHRLRLLGMGTGEINAIIEKADDARRFFVARSNHYVCGPVIKEPNVGSVLLEMADEEEVKATSDWGKTPPPEGELAPPPWMPIQVVLFSINVQGQWASLHGNPLVTFACATDEIEDIIHRYGRRRGLEALESAGLRRGRSAVIDQFKPTYIDEEREKERKRKKNNKKRERPPSAQQEEQGQPPPPQQQVHPLPSAPPSSPTDPSATPGKMG